MPHCAQLTRPNENKVNAPAAAPPPPPPPQTTKGADLLLSLAATAHQHAPRELAGRYSASALSRRPLLQHYPTLGQQPQSYPMNAMQQQQQQQYATQAVGAGRQLCPSPIQAPDRDDATTTTSSTAPPSVQSLYPATTTAWMPHQHQQQQQRTMQDYSMMRPPPVQTHAHAVDQSFDSQDSTTNRPLSNTNNIVETIVHTVDGQRIISPTCSNDGPAVGGGGADVTANDHSKAAMSEQPQQQQMTTTSGYSSNLQAHHPHANPGNGFGYAAYPPPPPPASYGYPPYGYYMPAHGQGPPPQQQHQQTHYAVAQPPHPPVAAATGAACTSTLAPTVSHAEQEWQSNAAASSAQDGSTHRCMPLKPPVPAKYFGKLEATAEIKLPDFHLLVNYPDYITKGRATVDCGGHVAPVGHRHCVMCGKLRVCSGSARASRSATSTLDNSKHIIPRQNKGVCTACDIMVWSCVPAKMELKWCKGCKNFRAWAAFGQKGLATKCVPCRERQKEKYRWQKEQHALKQPPPQDERRAAWEAEN